MDILFLTIGRFDSIESHSIYADLLRCFRNHGHEIYTITPIEKKTGKKTELIHEKGAKVLHLETGDVTESKNLIRKGLAQMSIEPAYIKAIKKYFSDVKFDLVMYSTPPITLAKAVEFVKKRDGAKTYLLLKDIFPQNAVDLGMMSKSGLKGFIYRYFLYKEKRLYAVSDRIGCMSEANVRYVIEHNPDVDSKKIEVCPNAVEVIDQSVDEKTRAAIRKKYNIPYDKTVFVYGGNLGKPQGIPFLIECLRKCSHIESAFFLIVGEGTEYHLLQKFMDKEKPRFVKLMKSLPREEYDVIVGACDVGLVFLDHRFTIPNFPSRLLAYMQAKLPVLACTDLNTDVGKVIVDGGFGWWCESTDSNIFENLINQIVGLPLNGYGEIGFKYLTNHYSTNSVYKQIIL